MRNGLGERLSLGSWTSGVRHGAVAFNPTEHAYTRSMHFTRIDYAAADHRRSRRGVGDFRNDCQALFDLRPGLAVRRNSSTAHGHRFSVAHRGATTNLYYILSGTPYP